MAKAVGNLVMHLTVDDSKVTPTINTMKQQLRDLNATWRANVEAAKAAGDTQEAARAKAEGLGLALLKQKEILDSMNTIMRNTGERTDSNALAYDRMTTSISRAEAQYKNLINQEQAALVILDKQETGIDELNRSIKANDDLTQAQIKSLKQQGDELGANELKVKSLKEKQQALNEVQEKEEQILKNVIARSGENSRAYTEQAAVVQNAKNNIAENNAELLKYNKRIESTTIQLKELKSSYSSIKEAQDSYITRLKAEGHQNEANVADLNKLKQAYANLGEQYKLQMTQLNSSSVGSKGYQEAYVAVNKTATEMARLASQSRNTQNEINKMNPYGISKIGTALNTVSDAGDLMGKKVVGAYQAIRRNAATIALSVGIAGGALLKGAQTAADIQNSFVKTNNLLVTGGEKQKTVTAQVAQMQKDGAKYATEYGYSQKSIADGYEELVKRGYDGAQSIGSMKSLMQAARATGDDYSDVVRNTATALENFNMRSDDTNKMMENTKIVTNQMAYAADLTATQFSSLGKAMEYVGPSAHKSGVSLSETASAIGILSNNGLEADKAGTGLRMVLNKLTAETPAGTEALKGLGLSTKDFVDTAGKLKPVNEIFGILNSHMKGMEDIPKAQIFHTLFGTTGQAAGSILSANATLLGELNKKVAESANGQGYVAILAQKNMQTTKARLEQLRAVLEKVAMSIGQAMLPAIDKAAEALEKAFNSKEGQDALKNTAKFIGEITDKTVDLFIFMGQHIEAIKIFGETLAGVWAVNKIGSYISSTKRAIGYVEDLLKKVKILQATEAVGSFKVPLATTGAGVTTSAVRAGVANGTLSRAAAGGAVSVGASAVGAGAGSLTGASSLAGLAVAAAPVAAVVASIAAVGAAVTLAYKHIKEFKKFVNDTAKSVNDNFIKPLAQGFGYIGDTIADVSKGFAKHFGKGFKESSHHIKEAIDAVKKAFKDVGDDIGKALKPVTKKGGIIDGITDAMNGIGNWISVHKKDFEAIGEFFGKVFADITATLVGVGSMFVRVFGNMIPPLISGIVALFKDAWKIISGLFSGLADIGSAIYHLFTGNFKGLGKDLKNIFKDVNKIFGGIVGAVWDVVKTAFKMGLKGLDGLFQSIFGTGKNPIEKFFKGIGKSVDKFFKGANKKIKKGLKAFGHWFSDGFHNLISGTIKSMAKIGQGISKGLDKIGKWFLDRPKVFINNWKHNFKVIADVAMAIFKEIKKGISSFFKFITDSFNNTTKFISKLWKNTWNGISEFFEKIWDGINKFFTPIINWLGDVIHDTVKSISKTWSKTWNGIFDFFGNIWDGISKYVRDAINGIHGTIRSVVGSIDSVWRSTWNGLGDFFSGIWGSIKGYAQDGINGVLNVINAGVDAIDSVWKFFTGHETSIHHLRPVKFAQGGIVKQRLAMVNDGDGPDWKELIQLPNGEMKMSQKRNAVMPLPVGTRVYNGAETKAIMNYAGIEKYANGGVVGGAIDWAKGALSNVGSWIGDKFDAIDSFLKNPLNAVMGLIQKATSGLIGGLGNFGQLASGTLDKLMSPISDWFTKGLKKVQEEGQGAPAGAGVQRWAEQVKSALSANGLSTSEAMVQKVLRQIQTESGGNERAVQGNIGDVNNASGDLAKGLMQVISATFNAFKFPGHNNPFNGYDSLLAGLNYAKNRYGSNLSFLGQGHGYANGGLITKHQIAEIGEGNKPEMIIPLDGMKSSRGFELLGRTAVAMAARDGQSSHGMFDSSEITQLLNQNNQLLGVVTQLLGTILSETEKGNEPLGALSVNRLSRLITSSTVRSSN